MVMWWQLCVCSLGILLLGPCSLSEKVSLAGSPRPVVGVIGRDAVLPCQLSPAALLPNMDMQWRKAGSGFILVHEYMNERSQDLPGESYQNRTELFLQEFSNGNVSLKLKRLQATDAGTYHCYVRNLETNLEATTELRVAAVAPVFVDVLGPQGQGIGLDCRSTGWFPKPELQWFGKNGQNLAMEIVTNVTQDRENLYTIVSHVTVTEEDNRDISCIVKNGLLEPERQSAIHLSSDIFPRVSPWLTAFWVLFILVLIAAGACAYLGYTVKQKISQKEHFEKENLLSRASLESECQELREKLDRADAELDFRRARSYVVPITLDPSYRHPKLTVSADGRTVQHESPFPEPAAPSGALIAVGKEGFTITGDPDGKVGFGRWYWEVQVGDSPDWELGVLSETERGRVNQEGLERPPKEGYWSLRRSEGRYHPKEAADVIQDWNVKPTIVGVYLDLEEGHLSFYSVSTMTPILKIPVQSSKRLFPFLSPGFAARSNKGEPLSICPPSDWYFRQQLMDSRVLPKVTAQTNAPRDREAARNNKGPPPRETAPNPGEKSYCVIQ